MVKKIKMMADYHYYPLWDEDEGGDIELEQLPLQPRTMERLMKWQHIYDNLLNNDDPASSGFSNPIDELNFELVGISLWQQLKRELADNYEVIYFCEITGNTISSLDELQLLLDHLPLVKPLELIAA